MRVNVEKVLERDQKLSEMDRRADELQVRLNKSRIKATFCKACFSERKYWDSRLFGIGNIIRKNS